MEESLHKEKRGVSPVVYVAETDCYFRPQVSLIQLALAEEKARVLWESLQARYDIPREMETRFVTDKTADFLRSVTTKDRKDIIEAIDKDLERRRRGGPPKSAAVRRAAAWSNRWGILITGLKVGWRCGAGRNNGQPQ